MSMDQELLLLHLGKFKTANFSIKLIVLLRLMRRSSMVDNHKILQSWDKEKLKS